MNQSGQKEFNLIVQLCHQGLDQDDKDSSPLVFELTKIDWLLFLRLARYHKVRPLLYKGIIATKAITHLPEEVVSELRHAAKAATFRNLQNAKELIRLGKLLDENHIDFIPLKGIVLSLRAYRDIGIRESSDIDLLIKISDFKKIQQILLDQGYIEELSIPKVLHGPYFRLYCEYNFDLYGAKGVRCFRRIFHMSKFFH